MPLVDKPMVLSGIFATMRDWFQGVTNKASDFTRGSVLRTLMEAISAAVEEVYYRLYFILPQKYFLAKAREKADVDVLVADHTFGAVTRKAITTASGTAVFTGTAGTTVPNSFRLVARDTALLYQATESKTILTGQTTVEVTVSCLTAGADGNVGPSRPMDFVVLQNGLTSAMSGLNGIGGGADEESSEDLKKRVPDYFHSLTTGTPVAIEAEARKIAGVKEALYRGSWPNPGAWTCFINDGSGSAQSSLLKTVYDALAKHRDAEIIYYVEATSSILADIRISLQLSAGLTQAEIDAAKTAAQNKLVAYLLTLGYDDDLFQERAEAAVDGAHSAILSNACTILGPATYNGWTILETTPTGQQRLKRPTPGTVIRAGTITVVLV
jgi:hypothetical protein